MPESREDVASALRWANEPLAIIQQAGNFGIWDWDLVSGAIHCSAELFGIFGLDPAQHPVSLDAWRAALHPDDRVPAEQHIRHAVGEGRPLDIEFRVVHPDGSVHWINTLGQPTCDSAGKAVRLSGISLDITERKRADSALRETEDRLRLFMEHVPAAVAMFDREMRYVAASHRWHQDYRLGDQNIIGKTHYEVFPEVPERWREIHRRCLAGAVESCEADPFPRADGSVDWVKWEVRPWYGANREIGGIIMFTEVITQRIEAAEELRQRESLLRAMSEGVPDPLFIKDRNGRMVLANAATLRAIGKGAEQVIGYRDDEYFDDPAIARVMMEHDRRVMETGKSEAEEEPVPGPEGLRIFLSIKTPWRDANGQIIGIIGCARDITETKRAQELLRNNEVELSAAQRLARVGSWRWDIQTDTAEWSDETFRIFGMSRSELVGHRLSFLHLIHPEDRSRVAQALSDAVAGIRDYGLDYRIELADNTSKIIHAQGEVLRDHEGRAVAIRGTVQDITERTRWERQIEEAKKAAETANSAKDQFIAALSHELRTPLTPVLAAISAWQEEAGIPEDMRHDLATAHRNIELETRLIDDLLDLTRVARGKMELQQRAVDLAEAIRRVARICSQDFAGRGQKLELALTGEPYPMMADPARLHQLFWNILKNASKFTPEGGSITIRASTGEGRVIVEVVDTGVGIEPELLPRVFNPFEQGEAATTRRLGGLGLGLAICKSVVEMHGGRITLSSAGRDLGTTVTVELPLDTSLAGQLLEVAHGAARSTGRPGPGLRILLVEDHADSARLIAMLLRKDGHRVTIAGTVKEGVAAAAAGTFDLLVSDLGLPDGTGRDLLRALTASGRRLPGIVLSGYGTKADIERSMEAGFHEHLVKPVTRQMLREAIARVMTQPA